MELQQSFTVPFPPDAVWRSFHDTEALVACLPGASLAAPPDADGNLKLGMNVKLGPIAAAFAGDGRIALDEAAMRGRIEGGGADRRSASRVKGTAAFALLDASTAAGPATRVDVNVDYGITGSLAQFSRGGIVNELAARLTEAFADNLKRLLEAAQAAAPDETDAARIEFPAEAEAVPKSAAQLAAFDVGSVFWPMLWHRFKRFLGLASR